jgi:hypothetical protein
MQVLAPEREPIAREHWQAETRQHLQTDVRAQQQPLAAQEQPEAQEEELIHSQLPLEFLHPQVIISFAVLQRQPWEQPQELSEHVHFS